MQDQGTFRPRVLAGLVALAGLALSAPIASAERVTDVRIGRHGEYTRVVIELDAAAGYKLEKLEKPGEAPEILVRVDAAAAPREVASQSDVVKSVKLESRGEGSVARIALRTRDIRLAEMKLSAPARIVLDVRRASGDAEEGDVASRFTAPTTTPTPAAPKIVAEAPPAKPAKKPLEVPKAAPATPPPLPPRVEAELEAVARGENVLDEEVEAVRGAAKKPADAGAKRAAPEAPPAPAPDATPEAPLGRPTSLADAGSAAPAETAPEAAPAGDTPVVADSAAPAPPGPAPAAAPKPAVPPPPVIEEGSDPTLWLGAAVVLIGFLVAWRVLSGRRKRDDGALAGIPPDAFDDRAEAARAAATESPATRSLETPAASPSSFAVPDAAEGGEEDAGRAQSSLFDDDVEDDADAKPEAPALARPGLDEAPTIARPVALDDDLPGVPGLDTPAVTSPAAAPIAPVPAAAPAAAGAASPAFAAAGIAPSVAAEPASAPRADDEVLRIVRELERRLGSIEQRLAQTVEARERIERQLVAQTEELRVQRAAIARTQRVLRALARPEDLAGDTAPPRGPGSSN